MIASVARPVSAECRGCKSAIRKARRLGIWVSCGLCGQEYQADPGKAEPKPAPKMSREQAVQKASQLAGSDLGFLAVWAPRLYGKAAAIEPTIRGNDDGRREDERGNEWHRAMMVHRRFERFRFTYRAYADALWFVYAERTGGTATGLGNVFGEVAKLFAPRTETKVWKKAKGKSEMVFRGHQNKTAVEWGQKLHDDAVVKYAEMARKA